MASARSAPRPPIGARRARAARARGARQVHLRHEGDGAPRVARPVQALGATVRPAPAARRRARSRRCRRCALRVALPRRALGPSHAASDAAAAVLPVVGRRPSAARAPLARAADRPAVAVGQRRPARPHGGRAGTRTTPSSRRCRRRPTGRASRFCECPPPPRSRGLADAPTRGRAGRERARTTRARLGMCGCVGVYAAVHACVGVRMRACAECIPAWACAWACACAC
jgi:hypothetical protein